ncbi:MAG: NAD(P)H-dependent oxidoreductase [Chitinophagales bacterium]|jgi:NAD(P)H-dependent FMN reductase|nr:NAD(P)H-dependent oxidoreductase [Chitinophagales bacterium]
MKILSFAGSNSRNSINKAFVSYVTSQFSNDSLLLDLNDFELPIYGIDYEKENGIPEKVSEFYDALSQADVVFIGLSEHNGTYTAVFKNLFDWLSRKELKFLQGKKVILCATAPGPRGGRGVMDAALVRFPIHGAELIGSFCLPKFNENFQNGQIVESEQKALFDVFIAQVKAQIG